MKYYALLLPVILVLSLSGCAKPPKAEIDAAEAAVARAEQSPDVVLYAPEALQRAQKALERMRAEVSARHYDKAKAAASEATTAATDAVASAQANKERAKSKAEELIGAVKQALPQAEKLLANALKVKKAKIDRAAKTAELEGAKAALAEAEASFAQGDYLKAIDKAGSAQKALADFESEIGSLVQAATRKK
jgi:hypothetical protein